MPTDLLYKGLTAPKKATPTRSVKLAPEGVVTAIVGVTGVTDAVADLIVPGAFAHSLTVRRPKVVSDHEWKAKAGRVLHVEEWMPGDRRLPKRTKDGKPWPAEAGALVATMQYNLNTQAGREAYEWVRFYAESNEAEFSIGYKVPEGKARLRRDGVRVILMVDLFEFSHVLFGAAPLSMALEVKSMHGGSAGTVTRPALTADDDSDDDYTDTTVDTSRPWDDEQDKPKASIESKTAASVLLEAKVLPKTQKCEFCKSPATKRLLWAEGMAYIPACDDHEAKARSVIEDDNNDEVSSVRPIETKDAGTGQADPPKEVKAMSRMKGSYEERIAALHDAARELLETTMGDGVAVCPVATYDHEVVVTAYPSEGGERSFLIGYQIGGDGDGDDVELTEPQPVELSLVAEPEKDDDAPKDDDGDDVETVTVVAPILAAMQSAAAVAQTEGKAAAVVREAAGRLFAGLASKSAEDPENQADDAEPDGDADEDLPGEVEADADTISKDNLPDGDWGDYRKTQPIQAMRMDGPFTVQTREGVVHADGGWLAVDSDGYPYPIATDEFDQVYSPADGENPADAPDDAEPDGDGDEWANLEEKDDADPDQDGDTSGDTDGDGDGGTVTLNPDEHFATMDSLDAGDDADEES